MLKPSSPGLKTKRLPPKHKTWAPHRYQTRGVEFLIAKKSAGLFLDPGLGKTAIVLEAFRQLKNDGAARRMLVVAPLRVCQLVWRQEGDKWTQFRHLRFSLLHGPKKAKVLKEDADVYLINPEGIPWLVQQFFGKSTLPFDVVCIDELTKFKNHRAKRSRQLRKKIERVKWRWGLTGSPAPNGYEDLFGQILILDGGKTFGTAKTYFLDQYFRQGFNGFDWELREGAGAQIERKIAPMVLSMSADDYLQLPPIVPDIIDVTMPPAAVAAYEEMKAEMLTQLPEGVITAANSGGVYAKLKQLSNGAVYLTESDTREFAEIHSAKIEALQELIEELSGRPLLVAYEFQHDLIRLRAALGKDTPALAGLNERRTLELEAAWNRGELPVLLAHPASAGHGLNLQAAAGSGTAHLCWFSLPWDLELYEQMIRRLRRQGSEASRVVNHILRVRGGMDDIVIEALEEKDTTQQRLRKALNAEILRDDPSPPAAGNAAQKEESNMAKKLGFRKGAGEDVPAPAATKRPKGWGSAGVTEDDDDGLPPFDDEDEEDEEEEEQPAPQKRSAKKRAAAAEEDDERPRPKGWGKPAATEDDEGDDDEEEEEQRERIRGKIRAPETDGAEGAEGDEGDEEDEEEPPAKRAMRAFPKGVAQQLTDDEDDGDGEEEVEQPAPAPKKRGRKKGSKNTPKDSVVGEAPEERAARKADAEQALEARSAESDDRATWAYATDRQAGEQRGISAPAALAAPDGSMGQTTGPTQDCYFSLSINSHGVSRAELQAIFAGLAETLKG
jgi:hypothetical protein